MNGNGILFTSDHRVFAEFQFVNDQINGICIINDRKGVVCFRCILSNGEK